MELQQLRYVVAVDEEKNFTRAAEKCHVVQSALSHQIKSLERELGVQLFARTSRRVELTAAGAAFLPGARATLDTAGRAIAEATAAPGEIRGKLSIGIIPTVTGIDIPAALGAFHRRHPAVQIQLSVGGSNEFMSAIHEGAMDVAVLGLPDAVVPERVAYKIIARERLVAVINSQHPLAGHSQLLLSQLAEETFADFPTGTSGRVQSDLSFSSANVPRRVAFEMMNTELLLALVEQNLAIAMLSPALVPDGRDFLAVPVADGPTRIGYLAWSDFNPSPAALAFLDLVQAQPQGE